MLLPCHLHQTSNRLLLYKIVSIVNAKSLVLDKAALAIIEEVFA